MRLVLLFICFPLFAWSQSDYSARDLKNGKFEDDSSYIYTLPFQHKKKVFLIQAYESKFSHRGERSLDFKVKNGTTICAAREGVVIGCRSDSDEGGLKPQNMSDGNFVSIQHTDGSIGHYWHLKKNSVLVIKGDSIACGQPIASSGNTGYSAFPHLHFEVQGVDAKGNFRQIATRFKTNEGVIYLTPGKFYRTRNGFIR